MTVEEWREIAMCVHASSRQVTGPTNVARLIRLRAKCEARLLALQEGRVIP